MSSHCSRRRQEAHRPHRLNLKIAVEQTSFLFLSRKERKEHKERMFLLIIIAVLSVRQFTQLVKAKNRKHAWIIRNKLHIAMCFATFATFAAKILESNCDVWVYAKSYDDGTFSCKPFFIPNFATLPMILHLFSQSPNLPNSQ